MAAAAVARPEEPDGSFRRYLERLGALRSQPGAERPDGGRRTELHLLFDQLISESCGPAPAAAPSAQVRRGPRPWGRGGGGRAGAGARAGPGVPAAVAEEGGGQNALARGCPRHAAVHVTWVQRHATWK